MKHFSSNKKINSLHIKCYFMANNSFVAEVTFKLKILGEGNFIIINQWGEPQKGGNQILKFQWGRQRGGGGHNF